MEMPRNRTVIESSPQFYSPRSFGGGERVAKTDGYRKLKRLRTNVLRIFPEILITTPGKSSGHIMYICTKFCSRTTCQPINVCIDFLLINELIYCYLMTNMTMTTVRQLLVGSSLRYIIISEIHLFGAACGYNNFKIQLIYFPFPTDDEPKPSHSNDRFDIASKTPQLNSRYFMTDSQLGSFSDTPQGKLSIFVMNSEIVSFKFFSFKGF